MPLTYFTICFKTSSVSCSRLSLFCLKISANRANPSLAHVRLLSSIIRFSSSTLAFLRLLRMLRSDLPSISSSPSRSSSLSSLPSPMLLAKLVLLLSPSMEMLSDLAMVSISSPELRFSIKSLDISPLLRRLSDLVIRLIGRVKLFATKKSTNISTSKPTTPTINDT